MCFLELLWMLIEYPLTGVLQRSRLSRFFAVAFGVLGMLILIYSLIAPDSLLVGTLLAIGFGAMSLLTWKAGNWWGYKTALWKAQEGMPKPLKRRGFDVVIDDSSRRRASVRTDADVS